MKITLFPDDPITCAMPGCGARTTEAEAIYIDGCGLVCRVCEPPQPWLDDIDLPF